MDFLEGLLTRRSTRGYKSTPIQRENLEIILKAASRSPSYTNTQPWEVSVVTGDKLKTLSKALYDVAAANHPAHPDIPVASEWPEVLGNRSKTHNARRFEALEIERDDVAGREELRLANYRFFGAPCALFISMDKSLGYWSHIDLGLFLQGLLLAANSLGLGTCLQASLANYPEVVHEHLGIPNSKKIVLGISIGYPDPNSKYNRYQSQRAEVSEFTKWFT
jgi:nitroreductase